MGAGAAAGGVVWGGGGGGAAALDVTATVGVLLGGVFTFEATVAGVRAGVAVRVGVAVAAGEVSLVGLAFPPPVAIPIMKNRTMKAPTAMPVILRGFFTVVLAKLALSVTQRSQRSRITGRREAHCEGILRTCYYASSEI